MAAMDLSTWLAFFAAAWAISLSPGAGAVAAMSAGLNHGFARGYVMSLGLSVGIWTQILVVGVGLGALIATSSLAFAVVKWAGVAYLVWLGIRQWRAPVVPLASPDRAERGDDSAASPRALFVRGWIVNALNPKGTIFLLAVMPQFLDLGRPLLPQYLVITATLTFTDLVVMAGYTALAARVLRTLKAPSHIKAMNRAFGALFVAAGTLLAFFKRA